jgi:phosphatidate cytidylyltransferase
MLKTRILTALVVAPLALFAAWQGGWIFASLMIILTIAGWREFYRMLPLEKKPNLLQYIGMTFSVGMILWVQFAKSEFMLSGVFLLILLGTLLLLASIFVVRAPQVMPAIFFTIAGLLYLGVGFSSFVGVRNGLEMNQGLILLGTVVVATWANDSFAYFVGRMLGKHKLCAEISPAKSVEGAIAGCIGAVLVVVGSAFYFDPFLFESSLPVLIVFGLFVGVSGILGDLAESGLKRWSNIKDSGNFFPGHGGVLDRLDSLLLVVPFTYLVVQFFYVVPLGMMGK